VLNDIAEKPTVEIRLVQRCLLPDDDARHGQAAVKQRGSRASFVGAVLGDGRETVRRFGEESETRECVKEERLDGKGNYGACVETTRRLALLPQACRRSLALRSQRLAPWKRSNQWYPMGLCGECFNARAGQEKGKAHEFNQRTLGSPMPG
jgi:hypothetical protein